MPRSLTFVILGMLPFSGSLADTGFPIPTGNWVTAPTQGFPAEVTGFDKMFYSPGIKASIILGAYHTQTSEQNNALFGYTFTTNRWDLLNVGGDYHTEDTPEGGHPWGTFTCDSNLNVCIAPFINSGSAAVDLSLHTWWFDPLGQTAQNKQNSPRPGLNLGGSGAFDTAHDTYVFFGAADGTTWTYSTSANSWQNKSPQGTPPPAGLQFPAMAYNSANQKVYLWAGAVGSAYSNALYTYDVPTNTWTLLAPAGTLPPPRNSGAFSYDSTNNIFLILGGQNASGLLSDTWVYDPVANQWTQLFPAQTPPVTQAPYERLAYDSDDNVFIYAAPGAGSYAAGNYGGTEAISTWFFRYQGTGPNAGTSSITPTPTAGGINNAPNGWANEPVLASSGNKLYTAWIEMSSPFDTSSASYPHPYAAQWSGTNWMMIGGSYSSLDAEPATNPGNNESHEPSLAVIGGAPWISWYKASPNTSVSGLYAKTWNGTGWSGGPVGAGNPSSPFTFQYRSQLTDVGGIPYIAFIEEDRSFYPWSKLLYVKYWNGTAWVPIGTGSLNHNPQTNGDVASSVSITSNGSTAYVAWTEYLEANFGSDAPPQVYVAKWTGSTWMQIGPSLNVSATNWAYDASITWLGGQPYVAWTERTQAGNSQLFVKTWNGTAWVLVGSGTLNQNVNTGWAFRPSLVSDATTNSLYLGWVEQANIGQRAQTYVSIYRGGSWSSLGASLNASPALGSAERIRLAVLGGVPIAAWGEVAMGSTRQVYEAQWNGSTWTLLSTVAPSSASSSPPPSTPAAPSTPPTPSTAALSTPAAPSTATAPLGPSGIPSTYNTSHPRLPHPGQSYLTSLANTPVVFAKYNAAADQWDSTNPSNSMGQFRRMLIAYLANKAAGNTAAVSTYLTKIKQLADLGGSWGPLLYSVNDGVGNGYTVQSASANFLTGCGGSSCANNVLSISGVAYNILAVVNANTVTLSQNNPPLSGSGLPVRIFASLQGYVGIRIAMIYDWIYADLDSATQAAFLNQMELLSTAWEQNYAGGQYSPYNDVLYIRNGPDGLIQALAMYPDFDQAEPTGGTCPTKPCGTYHLNSMMNTWFNVLLPVWQQIFGPDGGAWHEDWNSYVNPPNGGGLTTYLVPTLLSWQSASGDPIFTRLPWLKNFAYMTIYLTRPDFTMEHFGDQAAPYLTPEYVIDWNAGATLGSLNGLAEIYNDPVLRGWARLVNVEFPTGPDGFEPSAWPFYTPDNNSNAVSPLSALPTTRNFTGWGVINTRSGWTENDTAVTLKYGDNFWSHEHMDTGAFTIMHRGSLAIDSGDYRPGFSSPHERQYASQTIAHNTLTITDPNDVYPNEKFTIYDNNGNYVNLPLPNDGGQRRVGSPYNQLFPQLVSPNTITDWQNEYAYYHMGSLLSYQVAPNFTYAAVDITPAYNNQYSATTPNSTNRSQRVSSVIRNMVFIPPGYVIIFDSVNSTNASFVKKWLLHSVNQPVISGNRFEISRTELVTALPYASSWPQTYASQLSHMTPDYHYHYDGKLVGWMLLPQGGTLTPIGGPGYEFWIADPLNPGMGTNWNQCMQGQCQGDWAFLSGTTPDLMAPNPLYGPVEPGSWRIEESPGTSENQDYFLNVMLATNAEDTNIPAAVTGTSDSLTASATWSDSNNTYTITFQKSGGSGHIQITGAVNVNQDFGGSVSSASGSGTISGSSSSSGSGTSGGNTISGSSSSSGSGTSGSTSTGSNTSSGSSTGNGSTSGNKVGCDLNGDGKVDATDVQLAMSQALGMLPCTTADLQQNKHCDVVDVQRVINASLGGACKIGP